MDNFPYMVIGGILFIVLVAKKLLPNDSAALLLTVVLLTNTLNLFFLMFILGYGLVAYPQMLWNAADVYGCLLTAQQNAASQFKSFSEVSISVSQVVADCRKTKDQLNQHGDEKLNAAIDTIISECPEEFRSSTIGNVAVNKNGQITISSLAELRRQLNVVVASYRLAQGQLDETKKKAYVSEDIVEAKKQLGGQPIIKWSLRPDPGGPLEHMWYTFLRPLALRILAFGCCGLTVLTFLGVIGSFKNVAEQTSTFFIVVQVLCMPFRYIIHVPKPSRC